MLIFFAFTLPDGDIHVSGDFDVVPRIGDTVDISSLLNEEELASLDKYVREFLYVVGVHHCYDKHYHASVNLSIDIREHNPVHKSLIKDIKKLVK